MLDELQRDADLLRRFLVLNDTDVEPEAPPPCTLEDEMKPPALRPSVQRLIAIGSEPLARWNADEVNERTGLGYYPFNRI